MTRSFYTDTITRVRAGITASTHGGTREDWAAATRRPIPGCRVQALTATEREGRSGVTHRLLGPLRIDLSAADRVEYTDPRGTTRVYQVVGEPLWHRGPTGAVSHTETELLAVDI